MRTSVRAIAMRPSRRGCSVSLTNGSWGANGSMGADYSIADISLLGWVRNLIGFYEARELVGFDRFHHVRAWLDRGLARPAVQRGLQVTAS